MKIKEYEAEIEGMKDLLFDRFWSLADDLEGTSPTQGAVKKYNMFQFYTTDDKRFARTDEEMENGNVVETEDLLKRMKKEGITPAIPIQYWLSKALHECGGKVKVAGRQTIRDYVNSDIVIKEKLIGIGTTEHFRRPETILTSFPANKLGQRHLSQMPGFKEGWKCKFTIVSLGMVPKEKIKELLEVTGVFRGIGAYHKSGGYGRFLVSKFA